MLSSAPSLAHPDYRRYFAGQSVSLTGYWIQHTALTWLVFTMSGSSLVLGLVTAATSLPVVLLAPLGGYIADRFPRAAIMAVTQSLSGLVALALGLLVLSGHAQLWHFPALGFVSGVVTALEMPSRNAITGDLVPDTILPNATGLNSAQYQLARIIGPALAGVLIPWIGFGWCFIINCASYVAVVPVLISVAFRTGNGWNKVRDPAGPVGLTNESATAAINVPAFQGLVSMISGIPGLWRRLAILFIVGVFGWSWVVVLPSAAATIYRVSSHGYAVLLMTVAIGALLGSLLVSQSGRYRLNTDILAGLCLVVFACGLGALGFVKSFVPALFAAAPAGLGITAYINLTNIRFQTSVGPAFRGRVMGVYATAIGAMIPAGALVSGAISERFGPGWSFRIGAIVCMICGLTILYGTRKSSSSL